MSRTAADGASRPSAGPVVAQIMLSEEYSDLAFVCHEELFKVHKAVVCSQSSVIKAAVRSGFQESENNTLNMDAFTPRFVRRFIQFLYSKDYDDVTISDEEEEPSADKTTADESGKPDSENPASDAASAAKVASPSRETQHPELRDPVFKTILAHTRMNAMADYYDQTASPDAPWIMGLPVIAEAALDIVHNDGLSDALTTAVADHIGTILAMGTLEDSPLMTPFCLEVLKKCNAANQALSETLAYRTRTLKEVGGKYQKAAQQLVQQAKVVSVLKTTVMCRSTTCIARFDCYLEDVDGGLRLRCGLCHMKH